MRIGLNAHLLASQASYRAAGIHSYIANSLAHLPEAAPSNWKLTAMVGAANDWTFEGIDLQRAPVDTQNPARRVLWEQIAQPFALSQFDLYHAMAFVAPALPLRVPFVVTIYDLSFVHYPQLLSRARRAYLHTLTAHTCRRATRVIAISQSTADDLARTLDVEPSRIDIAPPGTDFTKFKPLPPESIAAFRTQHNLPDVFWLFVGTLEPRKNLPTLLRAYAQLPASARPLLVLAGGRGWDFAEIFETIQQNKLEQDVRLTGFVPSADLPLWYNSASTFIYPSVFEGFGMPVLEAMACGTPVIVSSVSSFPEVVRGTDTLTVPPLDVEAWVAALTTALDDADWRKQAGESGLKMAKRFTWARTAQATVESYLKALGTEAQ